MLNIFKKIIQNLPLFQILQNLLFNFDLQLLLQTLNSRFYTEKRKKKKNVLCINESKQIFDKCMAIISLCSWH